MIDLFKLQPSSEHPHGLSDREFDSLFTVDKPVMFNFHGYPQLIHRLAYRRTNHDNIHVRGYKEKGSINTPLELAIDNNIDRFSLAMDVVDRVPQTAENRRPRQGEIPEPADRVPELRPPARHRQTGSDRLDLAVLIRATHLPHCGWVRCADYDGCGSPRMTRTVSRAIRVLHRSESRRQATWNLQSEIMPSRPTVS